MHKYFRRLHLVCGLGLLLVVAGTASAADSGISGSVPQSYNAEPSVLTSMLVELKPGSQNTVVPLTSKDIHSMLGTVVPVNDAAIALTPQTSSTQQVLVAPSGHYSLLVSTQDGPIKAGDYLTVSALPGISMKAASDQLEVIGRASENYTGGGSNSLGKATLKGSLGRTTTVSIGHIAVDVRLAPNPLYQKTSGLNAYLTKSAAGIVNKPVTPTRAYLSLSMLLAALCVTGVIFYSATRNSMVSIGRNPLAKSSITHGMLKTIFIGLIIFAAGILSAFVILHA